MKRALLIGIDEYKEFPKLTGCVNDVAALAPLLETQWNGDPNFDVVAMVSGRDDVDRRAIIKAIDELLSDGPDVALFYFAGHGRGESNDVSLASADGDHIEPGVPVSQLLGKARNSNIKQIIIILDCCHSGGGGGSALVGGSVAILRERLAILAAARNNEIAKESDGHGLFSSFLAGALEGGAADITGKVSLAGVYAYLAARFGAWDQRPTFKANLDDSYELRRTKPIVPLEDLRKLPRIFKSPTEELPLDPTYERESPTAVADKVAVYDVLSHCRDANLIEPVGAKFLYHAAMQSKSCRLTQHGQHYWTLASRKRL